VSNGTIELPEHEERLRALAINDRRFVNEILRLGLDTVEASRLAPKTHAVAQLAALLAVGAAPSSYHETVQAALAAGASYDEIIGVLIAIVPAVGLARVVAAAPELGLAVGFDAAASLET
jgi:4-carboxymuconolactone decarboxylase